MEKGMNKRGQDLTIGTLILIVLGVVVLVLLIIGFTKGWDFIFGKFDIAPGQDLQAVQKSCELSAQADLRIDYCTFKEIEFQGETEYVNCIDPRIGVSSSIDCSSITSAAVYCGSEINPSKWGETKINGALCSSFTCQQLGGYNPKGPVTECNSQNETAGASSDSLTCCVLK